MAHGIDRIRAIRSGMVTRCTNHNRKDFDRYGGAGITVCQEWVGKDGVENFVKWALANGYDDSLTLDRIDGSKGYYPSNCRWVTRIEQCRNRKSNHLIEYNGEIKTLKEWADIIGVHKDTLRRRIVNNGWTIEEAITTPNLNGKRRLHHRHWRSETALCPVLHADTR